MEKGVKEFVVHNIKHVIDDNKVIKIWRKEWPDLKKWMMR